MPQEYQAVGRPLSKLRIVFGKFALVTAEGGKNRRPGTGRTQLRSAKRRRAGCPATRSWSTVPPTHALLSQLVICTIEHHSVLRVPADHGGSKVLDLGEPGATGSGDQDQRPKQAGSEPGGPPSSGNGRRQAFGAGKGKTTQITWKGPAEI